MTSGCCDGPADMSLTLIRNAAKTAQTSLNRRMALT